MSTGTRDNAIPCSVCGGVEVSVPLCGACMGELIERCRNCGEPAHIMTDDGEFYCSPDCESEAREIMTRTEGE